MIFCKSILWLKIHFAEVLKMCRHGFIKGMALGMAAGMAAGMLLAPKKGRPCKVVRAAGELMDSLAELIWK